LRGWLTIQTVASLGGAPQPVDCYNFGFKTVDDFLLIAQNLENTGVQAYDGAIASLTDPNLQTWPQPLRPSKPAMPLI
jgi:hypothetical protein